MIAAEFRRHGAPLLVWRIACDLGDCLNAGGSRGAAMVGDDYFEAVRRFGRLGWHVFPSGDRRLPVVHVCERCFAAMGRTWSAGDSARAAARRSGGKPNA